MKPLHYCLLLLLMSSCESKDKNLYEFDPKSLTENKITLSEIADDITYVPLDNSFPLDLIYQPKYFTSNSIYLSVKETGIIVFDRDGKFRKMIGSIGRGPGEYAFNYDFTIDDKNGTIYIHDIGDLIKVYSSDGSFLRSISLPEYGDNIETIESYNSKLFVFKLLQMGDSKYMWIVIDSLDNLIKKQERTIPMFRNGWGGSRGTYKFGNNLFYWNGYCDTVFSILPDLSYKASFIFSAGEHRVPMSVFNPFEQAKEFMHIEQIFETSRFLAIRYFYKRPVFVLIDKNNRKSFLSYLESEEGSIVSKRIGGIMNDLDGGPMFLPQNYFEENGREYMVGLINPYQIKAQIKSIEFKNSAPKYPEKKKEIEKLVNRLKETDNPVLVLLRLKK